MLFKKLTFLSTLSHAIAWCAIASLSKEGVAAGSTLATGARRRRRSRPSRNHACPNLLSLPRASCSHQENVYAGASTLHCFTLNALQSQSFHTHSYPVPSWEDRPLVDNLILVGFSKNRASLKYEAGFAGTLMTNKIWHECCRAVALLRI